MLCAAGLLQSLLFVHCAYSIHIFGGFLIQVAAQPKYSDLVHFLHGDGSVCPPIAARTTSIHLATAARSFPRKQPSWTRRGATSRRSSKLIGDVRALLFGVCLGLVGDKEGAHITDQFRANAVEKVMAGCIEVVCVATGRHAELSPCREPVPRRVGTPNRRRANSALRRFSSSFCRPRGRPSCNTWYLFGEGGYTPGRVADMNCRRRKWSKRGCGTFCTWES